MAVGWGGLSALGPFFGRGPRALPWAGLGRAVGAGDAGRHEAVSSVTRAERRFAAVAREAEGLKELSPPVYGYFDPPWIPGFLRRNEVMLRTDARK